MGQAGRGMPGQPVARRYAQKNTSGSGVTWAGVLQKDKKKTVRREKEPL
jgi:hypothetical protein